MAYVAPPVGVSSPIRSFCDLLSFSETSTSNAAGLKPYCDGLEALSSTRRSELRDETVPASPETALWSACRGLGEVICHSPELFLSRTTADESFFVTAR